MSEGTALFRPTINPTYALRRIEKACIEPCNKSGHITEINMAYISRRICYQNDKGESVECGDVDFFSQEAPLILLGEPGSGKTALLQRASDLRSVDRYNASAIDAVLELNTDVIIVDGVDEITAYQSGIPINSLLAKLPASAQIILSCRSADWQDAVNGNTITQKWKKAPVVGQVLPLNESEIVDFVEVYGAGQNAEEFIQIAQQHDVYELLKNPQYLKLLLGAVKRVGWPATKRELFENACLELTKEHNLLHDSINPSYYAPEQLIRAAGFICAQLLLSGSTHIRLLNHGEGSQPGKSELVGGDIDAALINATLSTMLFRPSGQTILEYSHRTTAEFLAAKWLAEHLNKGISLSRLECVFYSGKHVVPSALRGLHAWVATFSPAIAPKFIERDPYGFVLYGDPSSLNVQQVKILLTSLEMMVERDPYFRSNNWQATIGRGLVREELKDDFLRIIANPESPHELSHFIIESIRGEPFADSISLDLLELICDQSTVFIRRHAAVGTLAKCALNPNWLSVVTRLRQLNDLDSIRLSLEIIKAQIEAFTGRLIGELIVELSNVLLEDESNIAGLAYGLHKKMTAEQLEGGLEVLAEAIKENEAGYTLDAYDELHYCHFHFVEERFKREALPEASTIWLWLKSLTQNSFYSEDWYKFSLDYFSVNISLRQSLQMEAIKSTKSADELWLMFFRLQEISAGLSITEIDLVFHLKNLMGDKDLYVDWDQRWRTFVQWGLSICKFTGEFKTLVREHVMPQPLLLSHLNELKNPPARDFNKENEVRTQKYIQIRHERTLTRHKEFEQIANGVREGKQLDALFRLAKVYLGRYADSQAAQAPLVELAECFGEKIVPLAIEGIKAAITRQDIPSARAIAKSHTDEGKEFYFEPILVAYCAVSMSQNNCLSKLPPDLSSSALAACQWGICFGDRFTSSVQAQLEVIVFADKTLKENFVRDTMEPYLFNNADHIPGLERFVKEEQFSDIAGSLALEWINQFTNLRANNLKQLLCAVIRNEEEGVCRNLIHQHIDNAVWVSNEQRCIWFGALFLLDFDKGQELLAAYASEDKEFLWSFRDSLSLGLESFKNYIGFSVEQNYFIVSIYASAWPPIDPPSGGWVGEHTEYDAYRFVQGRINALAADMSDKAEMLLLELSKNNRMGGYQDYIKHAYAQQQRNRADTYKILPSLKDVRKILLMGEPTNHSDLQAILMDALNALQDRIRNSDTNDILPYWGKDKDNRDKPHIENYCRDRIASALRPYLESLNINSHPEAARSENKRCDLLHTHQLIQLPIEIKGQWNREIWNSAESQLKDYQRDYHSGGYGIYLVLWFGYLGPSNVSNPFGWGKHKLPKTVNEMKELLYLRYSGISEKTKIFVLDLSRS
jgi:hypothetical protein